MILFIASCSTKSTKVKNAFLKDKSLTEKEKLAKIIEADYLKSLGFKENEITWIRTFYLQNDLKRLFSNDSTLNESGSEMQVEMDRSIAYGIPKIRIHQYKTKKLHPLEKEVVLMYNFSRMISDLNVGFFDFENKKLKDEIPSNLEFVKLLEKSKDSTFSRIFISQGPADTNYRFLASNIFNYATNHKIDTCEFNISEKSKPEKIFEGARKSLLSKGWITEKSDSLAILEQLKLFQIENGLSGDRRLNTNTIYALNESTYEKLLRAALSLDRFRSAEEKPKKFVRVNIPEFKLYFYADDTLRNIHRIIVGKQQNQTPQLESKISKIIVNPYWKVPSSIANNEILPAVRRNRGYLAKNHYKIYKGEDQEVDPSTVNWSGRSSMPYTVIQQPGAHNSLGVIKFEFHNSYSVYVHDTPNKNLFNTVFRSYSHGCMRCDKPIELAKSILTFDSIPRKANPFRADTLDSLLAKPDNLPIPLIEQIPIYVVYETVAAEKENLIFHLDLYRREEELVKILKGKK
jgi:hypothetical protein